MRNAVIGAQRSQWILYRHGYANHGSCLQCVSGAGDSVDGARAMDAPPLRQRGPPPQDAQDDEELQDWAKGTLHHRLWFCPSLEEERSRAADAGITEEARAASPHD
eukprot:2327028-Pyramimonas_sp.AAC.1